MPIKEKLLSDVKEAMREKNEIKKDTIQMVRAAILQFEKDNAKEAEEEKILEILAKELKSRKDTLEEYEKSGRIELIDRIKEEIVIIKKYLPEPMSYEELTKIVKDVIQKTKATSIKDMGIVMKAVKEEVKTRADGKIINEIVKKELN